MIPIVFIIFPETMFFFVMVIIVTVARPGPFCGPGSVDRAEITVFMMVSIGFRGAPTSYVFLTSERHQGE